MPLLLNNKPLFTVFVAFLHYNDVLLSAFVIKVTPFDIKGNRFGVKVTPFGVKVTPFDTKGTPFDVKGNRFGLKVTPFVIKETKKTIGLQNMQNSKHILLVFLFGFFLTQSHGQSADTSSFKDNSSRHKTTKADTAKNMFNIKIDILNLIGGLAFYNKIVSLTLEKGFKIRNSVQLSEMYSNSDRNFSDGGNQKFSRLVIFEDYKFFWCKRKCFTGFYSGIYLDQIIEHGSIKLWGDTLEDKDYRLGGGLFIGYQNYVRKRLTVDFLLGLGIGFLQQMNIMHQYDQNGLVEVNRGVGTYGRAAINVGYRF